MVKNLYFFIVFSFCIAAVTIQAQPENCIEGCTQNMVMGSVGVSAIACISAYKYPHFTFAAYTSFITASMLAGYLGITNKIKSCIKRMKELQANEGSQKEGEVLCLEIEENKKIAKMVMVFGLPHAALLIGTLAHGITW